MVAKERLFCVVFSFQKWYLVSDGVSIRVLNVYLYHSIGQNTLSCQIGIPSYFFLFCNCFCITYQSCYIIVR